MIIEVDEYKNKIVGYDPNKSEDFHIESAKLADKDFILNLKLNKYKNIILMAGGTASGKTEFAYSYLNKKNNLIYDGTLKNYYGFEVKLQKIERYTHNNPKIKVVLIIPNNIVSSFGAFLNRERKMSPARFFETQIQSKITVAQILIKSKIKVEIFVSDVSEGTDKLFYKRIKMVKGRRTMANELINIAELIKKVANEHNFDININLW